MARLQPQHAVYIQTAIRHTLLPTAALVAAGTAAWVSVLLPGPLESTDVSGDKKLFDVLRRRSVENGWSLRHPKLGIWSVKETWLSIRREDEKEKKSDGDDLQQSSRRSFFFFFSSCTLRVFNPLLMSPATECRASREEDVPEKGNLVPIIHERKNRDVVEVAPRERLDESLERGHAFDTKKEKEEEGQPLEKERQEEGEEASSIIEVQDALLQPGDEVTVLEGGIVAVVRRGAKPSLWQVIIGGIAMMTHLAAWMIGCLVPVGVAAWGIVRVVQAPGEILLWAHDASFLLHAAFQALVYTAVKTHYALMQREWKAAHDVVMDGLQQLPSGVMNFASHLGVGGGLFVLHVAARILADIQDACRGRADPNDAAIAERKKGLIRLMAGAFWRATRYWSGEEFVVVFEDLSAFSKVGRHGGSPPTIACYHPHGVFSIGVACLTDVPEFANFRVLAAPFLYQFTPFFRMTFDYTQFRFGSASRTYVQNAMKNQENLFLVPGGVHEATIAHCGEERVYLRRRKGFVKYALQYGYSVTPVFAFGENLAYAQPQGGGWNWRFFLNSLGVPTILPFGWSLFPLMPKRHPLRLVIGKPIQLPKIPNPSKEDVQKHHEEYMKQVEELFNRHSRCYYQGVAEAEIPKLNFW